MADFRQFHPASVQIVLSFLQASKTFKLPALQSVKAGADNILIWLSSKRRQFLAARDNPGSEDFSLNEGLDYHVRW